MAHLFSRRLVVSLAALSLLLGCGGDDSPEKGLTSEGKSQTDRESAKEIVAYFERNTRQAAWFEKLRSARVEDRVVTFKTTLDLKSEEDAAQDICVALQGSDEADFARGNAVLGAADARYGCPVRNE